MARKKQNADKNSKVSTNAEKSNIRKSKRNKAAKFKVNVQPSTSKGNEDSDFEYEEIDDEYSESEVEIEVEEAEAKKTKKSKENVSNTKKAKTAAQKIECISIKFDIPDTNHPNHHFHNKIDRIAINEIIGFNQSISKEDVS